MIRMNPSAFCLSFSLSLALILNTRCQVNLDNDTWVLYNMMKHVQELKDDYGWFDHNNPNPCDWPYVACNDNGRVTKLGNFDGIGWGYSYSDRAINTTYWPQLLENATFHYNGLNGDLMLDNLPATMQSFKIRGGSSLSLNLTQFPDLRHLHNLSCFYIYLRSSLSGVVDNLGSKLPLQLEYLGLGYYFLFQKFPDFSAFSKMTTLYLGAHYSYGIGRYGDKTCINLTKKLPPNVKSLTLDDFRLDTFPNFVNYTNLKSLELNNINMDNDIITNLTDIIPVGVKIISIECEQPKF